MSVAGMELLTRSSLNSVRNVSQISNYMRETLNSQPTDDRNWWWGYLRRQFRLKNLEDLYLKYQHRLHLGYFSVFLVLQMVLYTSHTVILFTTGDWKEALPDTGVYVIILLLSWPLVIIVFKEKVYNSCPQIPLLSSCLVVIMLLVADVGLPLFHTMNHTLTNTALRPADTTQILLVCYVFLPLTENAHVLILGATVTFSHLTMLAFVTYRNYDDLPWMIASETVYLFCVNGLGLYFRFMNEVAIRRTFLDRRACLESKSKVEYEKQQEENLMLSILPRHIIEDVSKDIRKLIQQINAPLRRKPFSEMYVKEHNNVTILYADVVSYSKLTLTLPVKKLVEVLNELFGRFDEASEAHGVLRIKFLGDCYYCVSGVPEYNPHHAKNCVDLGLDMISIIKEVRDERRHDAVSKLDMRIGIHSGKILSGILGICKWQYDVWSRDVVIANLMEQTGTAGRVHVTKQTLNLLGNKYRFVPSKGGSQNPTLAKYNIETFFIVPDKVHRIENINNFEERPSYNRRYSSGSRRLTTSRSTSNQMRKSATDGIAVASRRRTVFMDENLYKYQQTLKKADEQMSEAIKNMKVGVYSRWFLREHINPLCLTFDNCWWEIPFLKQPDPLFKFYVGCTLIVLIGMMFIQGLSLPSSHWLPWVGYGVAVAVIFTLLPLTWTHYLWNRYQDPHEEMDNIPEPDNKLLKLLYKASLQVVWNATTRTLLYLIMCIILAVCTMLEVVECDMELPPTLPNRTAQMEQHWDPQLSEQCLQPWYITHNCSLTIIMSFLFLRIHFQLKLLVGIAIVCLYSVGIWIMTPEIYQRSETWNPRLASQIAHTMNIAFLTITMHLMDRQAEYMNRLDYKWKCQLSEEEEQASTTHMINKMLLQNILPVHVADWFLNTNRNYEELYHEEYTSVAVMFASLTEYVLYDDDGANEKSNLTLLNQLVCDFDKLLFDTSFLRVEKIKVAGWTYMAACGLDPGRRDSTNSLNRGKFSEHDVLILTRFAAKMMMVLQKFNQEAFQTFKLRVGISHGPVTAGVVGAQKPLYDIWGHPVNMASRMDSAGIAGRIQVTDNTARILKKHGILCERRGSISVKSIDYLVTTFFVQLDENYELVHNSNVINNRFINNEDSNQVDHEENDTQSGLNDQHTKSGSNDQHTKLGSNDQHTKSRSNDQHAKSGSNDHHTKSRSIDQHIKSRSNDQHTKSRSHDQHTKSRSHDQHTKSRSHDQHTKSRSSDQHTKSRSTEQHTKL